MGIPRKTPEPQRTTLHGTAVLLRPVGFEASVVFLRGRSGSGKSDLALRLMEAGGGLVCDDQVLFERRANRIFAEPVEVIHGLLEVRGVGLLRVPEVVNGCLRLVIDLVKREDMPRLPDMKTETILGVQVPLFRLHAFDISAVVKVHKAMEVVHRPEMIVK
ncbi:MAG: aldolase [Alphaproteobacteria bacterium]|nr:aldolase [Alphaproteobacteria bacterium]